MSGYVTCLDEVWCLANIASILNASKLGGYHESTASCANSISAAPSISRKML